MDADQRDIAILRLLRSGKTFIEAAKTFGVEESDVAALALAAGLCGPKSRKINHQRVLKDRLDNSGLNYATIAAKMGVSRQYVVIVAKGGINRTEPTTETAKKVVEAIRDAKGKSQKVIAEELGVSQSYVCRIAKFYKLPFKRGRPIKEAS